MVRFRVCILVGFALFPPLPLLADPVEQTLAIQKAMATGRVLLEQNRPREAVEVLQKELLHADGNGKYLQLLRDAYAARLKELQLLLASPEEIETVRRQLAILDRDAKGQSKGEVKVTAAAQPAKQVPPPEPVAPSAPAPRAEKPEKSQDPFQQVPLDPPPSETVERSSPAPKPGRTEQSEGSAQPVRPDRQVRLEVPAGGDARVQAMAAFDKKKYREANQLFNQIPASELGDEEKMAWGYSKLHEVSTLLNKSGDDPVPVAQLQAETKLALQLGGDKLRDWGQQVLGELAKRKPTPSTPAAVPEGWAVVEGANFRVVHKQMNDLANEVLRGAELARSAMYERWSGPVSANWAPKCDIWLHPTGGDYTQATNLPATSPGHSTVDLRGSKVSARRTDLRADVGDLIDTIVPHEVTYLIVQELFGEQPVPRWAEVAMTVMSEPPSQVSRYLRAVPKLAQEKRLMPVSKLMNTTEFPDAAAATPFFVESVSLVDYLVRLKGAKAFAVFLREAPRRGYEKALQTHYGFKDANELQDKWLKYASGQ